jgi:hypothetical protein
MKPDESKAKQSRAEQEKHGQRDKRTRLERLGKHALNQMGWMSGEKGLDVSHRLVWDVEIILHDWRGSRAG